MLKNVTATVRENIQIADGIYMIELFSSEADLVHFVPGQFANLSIPRHEELLLKRPISIHVVHAKKQTVQLVYQAKGKGTTALTSVEKGTEIEAIMPAGRGYHLQSSDQIVFLVGGGVGIAPLLPVITRWPDRHYEAFLGYRDKSCVYSLKDFEKECERVFISSNDGSIGEKGFVTDVLKERLQEIRPDIVISCGPPPMLRALKSVIEPLGIPAQVSMEQRMCCGFGACTVCVCGIDEGSGLEYKKVCVEGPVFDLYEVVL